MADIIKQKVPEAEDVPTQKIRITLTSTKVPALEKVCAELKNKATLRGLKVKGPVRLPTKKLNLVVRKAPSGEGTNTFDRWQMRIHKRLIDFHASADILKEITKIQIEPGVDVEVTMVE